MDKKNKIISSFFCLKCKTIPQIEINPKDYKLNLLVSCNCHKQLLKYNTLFKYFYYENLDINQIKNKEYINNSDEKLTSNINKQIRNYEFFKEHYYNNCIKIKNEIIENLKNTIINIEKIYEKNKEINNKIDNIMKILIKSYNSNQSLKVNCKNILLNTQLRIFYKEKKIDTSCLSKLMNKIDNFFNENYIIGSYKYNLIKSFTFSKEPKLILGIKNDIFAYKSSDKNIKINRIKNNEYFEFKAHKEVYNLIIDENNKYLISLGSENLIKFWSINEIEKKLKEKNSNNIVEFFPSYEFKDENNAFELINLENNLLCGYNDEFIFLYEYNIDKKNYKLINKKKIYENQKIHNLILIKRNNNKKFICCKIKNYLSIISVPGLNMIKQIKISNWEYELFYYDQISEDKILLAGNKCLKIISLNNYKTKLTKKIYLNIMYLKKLKDNTILVGGRSEIKRFDLKNFSELPQLIDLSANYESLYDDEDFVGLNLDLDYEDPKSIIEMSNGDILIILKYRAKLFGIGDE